MLSEFEANVLMLHVIRDASVFMEFCAKTRNTTFDKVTQPQYDFLAELAARLYDEHETYPGVAIMRFKLDELLDEYDFPEDTEKAVVELWNEIEIIPPHELAPSVAMDILRRLVDNQTVSAARERLLGALKRGESAQQAMGEIHDEMNKRRIGLDGSAVIVKPLVNPSRFMIKNCYEPTGIGFLDVMMAGGPRNHEMIGLLAPSSGGKTTFSIQLAISWLRQDPRRKSFVGLYEQPLEGDIHERILSNTTGLSSHVFRGKTFDELCPEIRQKLVDNKTGIEDRLVIADFSKGTAGRRGIDDIKASFCDAAPEPDGPPTLVVLDWFMPMLQRAMVGAGVSADDSSKIRLFGSRFMDDLKVWKNSTNIIILVTNQIAPSSVSSPGKKPGWNDASEWKLFAGFLDVCFCLGKKTDEGIAWLVADKTRSVANAARMVRLDGEYCRFVDADKDFMISSDGKIVKAVEDIYEDDPRKRMSPRVDKMAGSARFQ